MAPKVPVLVDALGACEHCGVLVNITNLPVDAMGATWRCRECDGELTHRSFGYRSAQGGKEKWVGPGGRWTEKRPINDFELGPYCVSATPPPTFL